MVNRNIGQYVSALVLTHVRERILPSRFEIFHHVEILDFKYRNENT